MKSRTHIQITHQAQPRSRAAGTERQHRVPEPRRPTRPAGNANAAEVDATFWIETLPGSGGGPDILQLQYTQLVQLDFNGLRWPHVTVATLRKQ